MSAASPALDTKPAPAPVPDAPVRSTAVKQSVVVSGLAVVALGLMVTSYFLPMWWVSLTAPNYPPDAFPDGIRIMFGFTGVSNGCTTPPKTSRIAQETQQEEIGWRSEEGLEKKPGEKKPESSLDCMHEMNTINHYVGMHPIGVGAPVERFMSPWLLGMLGVGLAGFAVGARRARVVVLGVGYAAVTGWMAYELWGAGRLQAHVASYMEDAGKYFREAERIAQWGESLTNVITIVFVVMVVLMVVMTAAAAKWEKFQLVLGTLPALLPAFFVGAYAAWLYFFGHNLHPWGAFTVKPFMPTVFGDGKVAQFSTHSYPTAGFAVLLAVAVLSLIAVLRRRLELAEGGK
ncbi:MAG: hypothetical protein JNJ54_21130 [Myxococcaceae bacterium]|nr:hypothetical protein [Myxococcaceae bacterium]